MSVGAQVVVVLEAFVEHRDSLVLGHTFERSWLNVSQTDVFHGSAPRFFCRGFSPNENRVEWGTLRRLVHLVTAARVPRPQWPVCLLPSAGSLLRSRVEKKFAHLAGHIAGDGSLLRPCKCLIQI